MAFVHRNAQTGAVIMISERDSVAPAGVACECLETGSSFDTLVARAQATGAPFYAALSFNPADEQFSWSFDVYQLIVEVDGQEVDLPNDTVQITADGTTTKLFTLKKKNLRTDQWETAAEDDETIQLLITRGLLRDAADSQNISEVSLVNGEAAFRVRSVAESVSARLSLLPDPGLYGGFVQLKFV